MSQDLSMYDLSYFTRQDCDEQKFWDAGLLRWGDQIPALCYAFAERDKIPTFKEIRDLYEFHDYKGREIGNDWSLALQLEAIPGKRIPQGFLDVGGGRAELAVCGASFNIPSYVIEPSPYAEALIGLTRAKFDMLDDVPPILFNCALKGMDYEDIENFRIDTVFFCETLEHIPAMETGWLMGHLSKMPNKVRVIIVNWIDYTDIKPNGRDHITHVTPALYDQLSDYGEVLYREGSHLVLEV